MTQLSYDNIFDALTDDREEAADLQFRAEFILALRDYCDGRGWSRAHIAQLLGVAQPRVSELMTGKIHLISADKLVAYASKLGFRLRPTYKKPSSSKTATIVINVELDELECA